MNSREKIIEAIKNNEPGHVDLPEIRFAAKESEELLSGFSASITAIGSRCMEVQDYKGIDLELSPKMKESFCCVNGIKELARYNVEEFIAADAATLNDVDIFIVKGKMAVAENGAIWITEKEMGNRLLPFLCRRLVIVVEEETIFSTLNEAYERITIDEEGYGVFIAGPSKTADIEQSLVIGAHGPLELQVFIVRKS